jgi:di/tripeptidase
MNSALLHTICSIPTRSYEETQMVRFLQGFALAKGYQFQSDRHNNVRLTKMTICGLPPYLRVLPCLAAHIDTVQPIREVFIHENGDYVTASDRKGRSAGFGADNKTGVYACLELLERLDNACALFFAQEEVGSRGAYNAPAPWFEDIAYVLEMDCPSRYMVSYTCGSVRLFENKGAFIKTAWPVLQHHGFTHWQRHPYTDVRAIRKRFPISCLNFSSGYHHWHSDEEVIMLSELEASIDLATALVNELDCGSRYTCPVSKEGEALDGEESLCPVTSLEVVTRPIE